MRIAVLRGGPSRHYDESLKTGGYVLSLLRDEPEKYQPVDVFISKEGEWHVNGAPMLPHKALRNVDLAWNALHGEYGEDGQAVQVLRNLGVPHTGSSSLNLSLSRNKDISKKVFLEAGLLTPQHEVLSALDPRHLVEIFRTYMHPVIVKPVYGRGGLNVEKAYTYLDLVNIVEMLLGEYPRVIVEELIKGDEASCGVIDGLRGKEHYALLPMPKKWRRALHNDIEEAAVKAHRALGLRHYSLSDFIVTPRGKIYLIETNALPTIAPQSPFHASLESVGLPPKAFIEHIVSITK